jgi:hypothetical protein
MHHQQAQRGERAETVYMPSWASTGRWEERKMYREVIWNFSYTHDKHDSFLLPKEPLARVNQSIKRGKGRRSGRRH